MTNYNGVVGPLFFYTGIALIAYTLHGTLGAGVWLATTGLILDHFAA